MANDGKSQRLPTALDVLLQRLSIVPPQADAVNPYSARAEAVRAELEQLEREQERAA